MALKSAQETSLQNIWGRKTLFQMRQLFTQFFLRSVISPYNDLYTQTVAYTMYFELGEPVYRTEKSCTASTSRMQAPPVVPYKALGNFPKALYGTMGGICSAWFFHPVMFVQVGHYLKFNHL